MGEFAERGFHTAGLLKQPDAGGGKTKNAQQTIKHKPSVVENSPNWDRFKNRALGCRLLYNWLTVRDGDRLKTKARGRPERNTDLSFLRDARLQFRPIESPKTPFPL